jgi:arabinose-5-phosphate isomerase
LKLASSVVLKAVETADGVLARAREVIDTEARTLDRLAESLGNTFVAACEMLCATKGRIVVAGIGKSGHICRKIAATLSATGSPAIYLHPGEAAHGDLGMVVEGDVVLALSNSGDTAELQVLYDHAENRGIQVVGITSRRGSLVARRSDICILVPPAREACPVNVAPTSSTTQQLALGDAIAMVLMDMRGFSRESVKALHPGGVIGLRLRSVSELMHGPDKLPLVALDLPMENVISRMTSTGFGIAGVVDDEGRLAGIITDGDLRRHIKVLDKVTAQEVMTSQPKVLSAGMAAEDALRFINDAQITCAFVVTDEPQRAVIERGQLAMERQIPIGIVHMHDFLRLGLS